MKVRFVLCHPSSTVEGEERQVFLSNCLIQNGHDSAILAVSAAGKSGIAEHPGSSSKIHFFPPDQPDAAPHRAVCKALVEALRADQPDLVLVKGVDYLLAADIFAAFPADRLGVIIGGTPRHRLLDKCSLIYFESPKQQANYAGPAKGFILPKYIKWGDLLPDAATPNAEFDIVNVGNFNESRKAQELLLPFLLDFKVAFVGDGARRPAVELLCADRKNATFVGYVPRVKAYSVVRRSRLMVHCATWDGYPRVVAESLACGVPVVGLAGVLDGIAEGEFLACVPLRDLYSRVFDLLQNPDRLAQLGKQAAEYMKTVSSYEALERSFLRGLSLVNG